MRDKGTGSVHYDGDRDRWVATVEAGRVDGKRRRLKATCRTEDDALRELERLRAEAARNLPPDLTNLSCHGYLHWWTGQLDGLADETLANYARHAADWADWLGGLPLSALTPQHVKAGLTAFLHAGFAPGTVGLHRTTLHRAMKDAVAWGMADTNPVTSVSGPRQPDPDPSYLRIDQARTLIDAARDHPLGACWLTGLLTGARVSEVLGLTWDRIDLDAGTVRFSHQLKRVKGEWRLRDLKTRKSRRAVAIPGLLVDLLTEHRNRQRQVQGEWEVWGNRWGLVFVTGPDAYRGPGAPLHISRNVTEPLKRLCEDLGLGHVNYRSLRHTNATLLLAAGVDVRVVQERLGHSSSRVTSDVYTHVVGELQAEAADRLGKLFDG